MQSGAIGESEKMMDLLLQWGQQRPEVRFFLLRRGRAPNLQTGKLLTVVFTAAQVHGRIAIFTSVTGSLAEMLKGIVHPKM